MWDKQHVYEVVKEVIQVEYDETIDLIQLSNQLLFMRVADYVSDRFDKIKKIED